MPAGFEISLDKNVGWIQPGKGYMSGERRTDDRWRSTASICSNVFTENKKGSEPFWDNLRKGL